MTRRAQTESLQGVLPSMYRTALYSRDEDDRPVRSQGGYPVKVRAGLGGTYTTAHAGSVGDPIRDASETIADSARMTLLEARVFVLVSRRYSHAQIVEVTGLSLRQVRSRIESANRKAAEVQGAVAAMGRKR